MPGKVRDVHISVPVEADGIACAALGEGQVQLTMTGGIHIGDGPVLPEVDYEEAVMEHTRALDIIREKIGGRQGSAFE